MNLLLEINRSGIFFYNFCKLPFSKPISSNAPGSQIFDSQWKFLSVFVQISMLLPRVSLASFFAQMRWWQPFQLPQIVLVHKPFSLYLHEELNSKVCRMPEILQTQLFAIKLLRKLLCGERSVQKADERIELNNVVVFHQRK